MQMNTAEVGELKISGYGGDYVFESIRSSGNFYEQETLESWCSVLEKPSVVFDIGANLGNHTVYFGKKLRPRVIYSFEPLAQNFLCLQRNIEQNHLIGTAIAVQAAVGGEEGSVQLKNYDPSNLGGTSFEAAGEEGEKERIPLVTVDSFLEEYAIDRLDLVKIDTEGFEWDVLCGMKKAIERLRPAIWVEVSCATHQQIADFLQENGYFLADIKSFNMLFLPQEKYQGQPPYDSRGGIGTMFQYLEKVNSYYAIYLRAKEKLNTANEAYQKLSERERLLNEKYQGALQNYEKAKQWHADSQARLSEVKKEQDALRQELAGEKQNLKESQQQIGALQTQNHELEAQKNALEAQKSELEAQKSELQLQKGRLQTSLQALGDQLAALEAEKKEMAGMLNLCAGDTATIEELLAECKKNLLRLQTQNDYLKRENAEYRRKLSKITDTWYGQWAIKCYHLLKRLKAKLLGR